MSRLFSHRVHRHNYVQLTDAQCAVHDTTMVNTPITLPPFQKVVPSPPDPNVPPPPPTGLRYNPQQRCPTSGVRHPFRYFRHDQPIPPPVPGVKRNLVGENNPRPPSASFPAPIPATQTPKPSGNACSFTEGVT